MSYSVNEPRVIVALSGGKASAWCADWALKNYPKEQVILYFNDTKWEHPDLYRFLDDLSKYFNHKIYYDSDGRSPEELFYDYYALANNRMPFCSKVLKADRLQNFYDDEDILVFGISADEAHRANRIVQVYKNVAMRLAKWPVLKFPLIAEEVTREQIDAFLEAANIEEPLLYKMGFSHNNCSGGCVRGGKKQWKLLYDKLPEVYLERERVEREVSKFLKKNVTFLKDISLEEFRGKIERGELPAHYFKNDKEETDCVGICSTMA